MHIPVSMHALHIIAFERTRMFFFGGARTDGWMVGQGRTQRTDGRMVRRTADGHGGWSDGRTDGWMAGRTEQRTDVAAGRTDGRANGQTGERTDWRKGLFVLETQSWE